MARRKRYNMDIYAKDEKYLRNILKDYGDLSLDWNSNQTVKKIEDFNKMLMCSYSHNHVWDVPGADFDKYYRLRLFVFEETINEIVDDLKLTKIEGSRVKYAYYNKEVKGA